MAPLPEDPYRSNPLSRGLPTLDIALGERMAARLEQFSFAEMDPGGVLSPETLRVLALVTLLQNRERLSDPQTAHALQFRPDWQASLQLTNSYPGLDPQVLCDFRQRLRFHPDQMAVFSAFLDRLVGSGLICPDSLDRLSAGELLQGVCHIHRIASVIEAATQIIEALATSYPEWFGTVVLPHWYTRYHPGDQRNWATSSPDEQLKLVRTIGADLTYLLGVIHKCRLSSIQKLPEVQNANRVWQDNYEPIANNGLPLQAVWRVSICARCSQATHAGKLDRAAAPDDRRLPVEPK
jgi:hypothetical protein